MISHIRLKILHSFKKFDLPFIYQIFCFCVLIHIYRFMYFYVKRNGVCVHVNIYKHTYYNGEGVWVVCDIFPYKFLCAVVGFYRLFSF